MVLRWVSAFKILSGLKLDIFLDQLPQGSKQVAASEAHIEPTCSVPAAWCA